MASDILISRLYDSDDRARRYFCRISTSLDVQSTKKMFPPFSEKNPDVCAGSCNGLLCLRYSDGTYLLWNPSNNYFKSLPPLEPTPCPLLRQINHKKNGGTMFAVPSSYGLGFDYKSKDYKLIRFIQIYYEDMYDYVHSTAFQVAVYSLKNNSWKDISDHGNYKICDSNATYVSGHFYWIARKFIVSFDLADEKFSTLPFPDVGKEKVLYIYHLDLMELGGSLGVVIYTRLGVENLFVFCVLEEGIGWTRKINYDFCASDVEKPLGFCRNYELFLLEGFDSKLLVYDYTRGELKKIDEIYDYAHRMKLFPYVENTITFEEEIDE